MGERGGEGEMSKAKEGVVRSVVEGSDYDSR